jgi:TolB protein
MKMGNAMLTLTEIISKHSKIAEPTYNNTSMATDWENQLILARFQVDVRLPGDEEAYRAWDNQTNQAVSLHLLPETDDESRRLVETRIRDLERVAHPTVLPYLGLFDLSGQRFWVEGYVDGPTLRFVLNAAAGQPLLLEEALTYVKSLSSALAGLHDLGWAHGNLSPESVRLGRDGKIYLSGLFAARRLADDVSMAMDTSALARLLYEMLAGALPNETPLPDLRTLNPNAPEFLARTLPRALGETSGNQIAVPTEFFLTACLASRVAAERLPDRIVSGSGSTSASLVESWNYLPPITPPPVVDKLLERDRLRRPPNWSWGIAAAVILGAGLMGWYFSLGQTQDLPSAQILSTAPTIEFIPILDSTPTFESLVFPTDTPLPIIDAPDGLGGRIVFTCTRTELNQLCMVKPTGGDVARLTGEITHDFYPAFSPDGKSILFASNRDGNYELYLKVLDGDLLLQLTENIGEVSSAAFSPDGKQIAFSNSVAGKPSSLWTVDQEGKHALLLYEGQGNVVSPSWSPNGKSIAFAMSSATALETYEIFILDLETNQIAPVTKGHLNNTGGSVDWSPDGKSLLLFAGTPGDNDIYILELVSGEIKQLTDGGNNAAPSWSPDGRWIVFNSMRASSENANIFIMRPDGSDVRQLTNDGEPNWQPRWGR